ncbi:SDR family NAD(P)-dependent oxidoreductase [Nonomuraea typhae]|uniref:SDR family NAD(P)-dependent oxidoreductase n=1 Tax=Nonomuraea typhae TaxID=2603600 RepID=A0ABW7Z2F0_9ACTN
MTVLITGTSGLGLLTARHLASTGRDVILVGRDPARTAAAARDLGGARTYHADLSQWAQTRQVGERLAADGIRIDVLINNAGAAFPRFVQTGDGAERTYAINHHAPFLLAHTLVHQGTLAAGARIINLSSFVEKRAKLDPADPDVTGISWSRRLYSQLHVYATSKLLSHLATAELARRLPAGISAYSANPGMVKGTAMNRNAGGLMRLTAPLFRPFSVTPDEGVQTVLWLATAAPAPQPSGGFFTRSREGTPSRPARDSSLARTVYERTAALLGTPPLPG